MIIVHTDKNTVYSIWHHQTLQKVLRQEHWKTHYHCVYEVTKNVVFFMLLVCVVNMLCQRQY